MNHVRVYSNDNGHSFPGYLCLELGRFCSLYYSFFVGCSVVGVTRPAVSLNTLYKGSSLDTLLSAHSVGSPKSCAKPYHPLFTSKSMAGFFEREGRQKFENPEEGGRGYLPQVNEWAVGSILWQCERVGGNDHQPQWEAHPVCQL